MVKCLPEFEYFTVFLKNKNIIFKIRRSKVTDYAALILLVGLLLIKKKIYVDNNHLHVLILKRNVSFRRFFRVPKGNTNDFFFKIRKLASPNDISNH